MSTGVQMRGGFGRKQKHRYFGPLTRLEAASFSHTEFCEPYLQPAPSCYLEDLRPLVHITGSPHRQVCLIYLAWFAQWNVCSSNTFQSRWFHRHAEVLRTIAPWLHLQKRGDIAFERLTVTGNQFIIYLSYSFQPLRIVRWIRTLCSAIWTTWLAILTSTLVLAGTFTWVIHIFFSVFFLLAEHYVCLYFTSTALLPQQGP